MNSVVFAENASSCDGQARAGLAELVGDRLGGLGEAAGDLLVAEVDPAVVQAHRGAVADPAQHALADVVDERDPGVGEDLRAEVRVAPRDRRRDVDDPGHPGVDERVRRRAVEVDLVDHRDVAAARPGGAAPRRARRPSVHRGAPCRRHRPVASLVRPRGHFMPATPRHCHDPCPRSSPDGPACAAPTRRTGPRGHPARRPRRPPLRRVAAPRGSIGVGAAPSARVLDRAVGRRGGEQLLGVGAPGLGLLGAREHARELDDALAVGSRAHRAARDLPSVPSTACSPPLSTTRCRSAYAATCARWVTTTTWWVAARRASRRPTSTAARPPTPASTSSNTSVGVVSAPASTTSTASITRESSPPEAPLCTGSGGAPGVRGEQQLDLVDAVGAGDHAPAVDLERLRVGAGAPPSTPTASCTDAAPMARPSSSADTAAPKRSAASRRAADTAAACPASSPASRSASAASAARASSEVSRPARRSRARRRPRPARRRRRRRTCA